LAERTKNIELLSPAKNLEYGIAAINYGADAVYIGAPKFGARAAVGNPLEDIEQLVKYAHKYWAKVYVTLNTVLFDNELNEARDYVRKLYEAGADALIIQDMAFLEMDLPPIPLFASTQTHNYSAKKIKFLQDVGFQRVILARELSLSQIKEIASSTTIELESFIHGALCVCYSGQCYFSYAISQRSANRGACLQACRMQYSLVDSKGSELVKNKYLLSLKDLNLAQSLNDLINAGVTSFKIEGRLKDINYVKNITSFYRKEIDNILENDNSLTKNSSGKIYTDFTADTSKTFNRGYSEYFIGPSGINKRKIASIDTPKSQGELLGKIDYIGKNFFTIKSQVSLHNGDGLCFINKEGVLEGFNVNKLEDGKVFYNSCNSLHKGMEIFRNHDYEFVKTLKSSKTSRKIDTVILVAEENNNLIFTLTDEDNLYSQIKLKTDNFEISSNSKLPELIKQQFQKTGNTIFNLTTVTLNIKNNYLIPLSVLNECRRNLFNAAENNRIEQYSKKIFSIAPNTVQYIEKSLSYKGNVTNKLAKQFYQRHGTEIVENGFELSNNYQGKEIMVCKYCIKNELNMCPQKGKRQSTANFTEPLYLKDSKRKYRLIFDCKNCRMLIIY
jgi:putative protease